MTPTGVPGHPWVLPRAGTPSPIPIFPQLLPPWTKVLRIMPNLPCVVQAGAMVFSRGSNAGDAEAALLQSLLSSCGLCEEVPESYIDIHTGLSGSGVAYVSQRGEGRHPGIWGSLLVLQAHPWMLPLFPGVPVRRGAGRGRGEDGNAGRLGQQDRGADAAGESLARAGISLLPSRP